MEGLHKCHCLMWDIATARISDVFFPYTDRKQIINLLYFSSKKKEKKRNA